MLIHKLEEKNINNADVKKLQDAGYNTIEAVAFTSKKQLILIKGLTEGKVDKILEAALALVPMEFSTASEYMDKRK